MSLTINHNLMAHNTARNLNNHYASLSTSVRRLSSGLRVNSSADDTAGLAIRELMRADIASLNQGVRNVNDAVSMIQTADGALQVIDEKLIRMKELAEQAATGTYNSDQRLMIDSEFQAMKAEIDRIAKATDFNGVKLLTNSTYLNTSIESSHIEQGEIISFFDGPYLLSSEIINENSVTNDATFVLSEYFHLLSCAGDQEPTTWEMSGRDYGGDMNSAIAEFSNYGPFQIKYDKATDQWISLDSQIYVMPFLTNTLQVVFVGTTGSVRTHITSTSSDTNLDSDCILTLQMATGGTIDGLVNYDKQIIDKTGNYLNAKVKYDADPSAKIEELRVLIDLENDGTDDLRLTYKFSESEYVFRGAGAYLTRSEFNLYAANEKTISTPGTTKIHFGTGNDSAEDYYYIDTKDCTANGLGIAGTSIETQDKAQRALEEINNAVIKKDTARTYFGAIQNRLENTASNLQIQAENLQASESRISDVDVSTEMTAYVRSQILTQAAVAMLSQANSLPNMALQLITNQ